jgi:hypothetical protein
MSRRRKIWIAAVGLAASVLVAVLVIGGQDYLAQKKIGYCFDVAYQQGRDRVFVAAGKSGMHVLDASEGIMRYASTYYDGGYYRNLKVSKDRAYIAEIEKGLVVLDISQDLPVTVWAWDQEEVQGMGLHVEGDRLYLAAGGDGLYTFDIEDPDRPRPLGHFADLEDAWDVWAYGDYAFVADIGRGLSIVDISSPEQPHQVGFVTWSNGNPLAEIVRGEGDVAYVAAGNHGLVIVDIADPAAPVIASILQTEPDNWAEGLAVRNGLVYLANGNKRQRGENGIYVIDAQDPYSPAVIGKVAFPDWIEGVHVAGDYAFLANTLSGVRSLDIRQPDHPLLVDRFGLSQWILNLVGNS